MALGVQTRDIYLFDGASTIGYHAPKLAWAYVPGSAFASAGDGLEVLTAGTYTITHHIDRLYETSGQHAAVYIGHALGGDSWYYQNDYTGDSVTYFLTLMVGDYLEFGYGDDRELGSGGGQYYLTPGTYVEIEEQVAGGSPAIGMMRPPTTATGDVGMIAFYEESVDSNVDLWSWVWGPGFSATITELRAEGLVGSWTAELLKNGAVVVTGNSSGGYEVIIRTPITFTTGDELQVRLLGIDTPAIAALTINFPEIQVYGFL